MSGDEVAEQALGEHYRIDLSRHDSEAFAEAFLKPRPVNERLRETIRRYRQAVGI